MGNVDPLKADLTSPCSLPAGGRLPVKIRIMYFVYIIKSLRDGSHYVGLTNNIDRRPIEHNSGKNQSTKARRPWILIHVEIVNKRSEARLLEKYFKSGYGREIIREIEGTLQINYSPVAQR